MGESFRNPGDAGLAAQRLEETALQAGLHQAEAVARRQGVAFDAPGADGGAIVTGRDGFTWLCGSSKRKAQLNQAQIAAGLGHRALIDLARGRSVTLDYRRLGGGGGTGRGSVNRVEADVCRRLAGAQRLARAEAALAVAHPSLAAAVNWVVGDGMTLAAVAQRQGRSEADILEMLRLALDRLAEEYGFRSAGAGPRPQ